VPNKLEKRTDWVRREVALWKERLLLNHWSIHVTMTDKDAPNLGTNITQAEVTVNARYLEARLRVFPALFTLPLNYRRLTIIHELCHLPAEEMREVLYVAAERGLVTQKRADDVAERVVEHMAKAVYAAYCKSGKQFLI
jgi:hypothetical protein